MRKPPVEAAPEVELLVGDGELDPQGMAAAHITVPPGGGMPEHDHGDSGVLLAVRRGRIVINSGGNDVALPAGALAVVGVGERVSLRNPEADPASVLAFFSPPAFAATVTSWPAVRASE
ncbi:MAG: cupin domain-containing protein [Solirubrobacterales bacterium]|nr:cupin domain-containing protein [Solirubrobacterales bacterium]